MKYEICHANKVIWVNWVLRWIVKEFRSIFSVVIFILNFRIYSIDYVRVCIPCSTVHRHNRIIPCVICFYSILLLNRDASIELGGTLAFVCAYFIADFLTSPNNKMYSIGISIYHTWKSVRPSILTSVVFIHFLADIPADDILELFGKTFFEFCQDSGYDKILQVLGATPRDFLQVSWLIDGLQYQQRIAWADTRSYIYIYILQNLDALHDHLGTLYPGMRAPSFRCTEESDGSLILHYYSERPGLEHIVIGIVKVSISSPTPR